MPIDSDLINTYSMWLSRDPIKNDGTIDDNCFMFLGVTEGGFDFKITYGGKIVGIFGMHPSNAMYMDGTGGAKSDIAISTIRANPTNPDDRWAKIANPGVDYYNSWLPTRVENRNIFNSIPNPQVNNISNYAFIEELQDMKVKVQMLDNAYVLRIYRGFGTPFFRKDGAPTNPQITPQIRNRGYVQFPVYLKNARFQYNVSEPNIMSTELSLFMRNPYMGLENIEEIWQ